MVKEMVFISLISLPTSNSTQSFLTKFNQGRQEIGRRKHGTDETKRKEEAIPENL
jgi:hypothetical protein